MTVELQSLLEAAWERRTEFSPKSAPADVRDAVNHVLGELDAGRLRVAEREAVGQWKVNQWIKKAVLLSFRLNDNRPMQAGDMTFFDKVPFTYHDKVPLKTAVEGVRIVPPATVRYGAYVEPGAVLMPSYVNIGAYVDEGTMVDTWATVGSCAQIGKNVHLSGGVGIGGVLEPLQANPVIIEDDCFVGARSEVAEGVIVREGSVLSMGVYLTSTTPIIDRRTGEVFTGEVPPYSVVMSGSRPSPHEGLPGTYCAVIMKTVDARTRAKTSINELLRD